jgi:hypothetical protein
MEYNLESIKLNLKIKYFNTLIHACNKANIDTNYIQAILHDLTKSELENYSATEKNIETEIENKKSTIDYLYQKPWTKLTLIHKIIKIKEFVNNLEITDNIEKEQLKDNLIELIKNKKVKTKINYDETKTKIISISNLSFENGKYLII